MARALSNQIFTGDSTSSPARAGMVPEGGPATQVVSAQDANFALTAKLIVFSDSERTFVFAWQWPKAEYRADKQSGFNNTLFHRTERCPFRASEIIILAVPRNLLKHCQHLRRELPTLKLQSQMFLSISPHQNT